MNSHYLLQSFFSELEALAAKYKAEVAKLSQQAAQPAQTPAEVPWTHEKVMAGAKKIVDKHGGNTNPLIEALHRLGYQKVSMVPVEDLPKLVEAIKQAYGEK